MTAHKLASGVLREREREKGNEPFMKENHVMPGLLSTSGTKIQASSSQVAAFQGLLNVNYTFT